MGAQVDRAAVGPADHPFRRPLGLAGLGALALLVAGTLAPWVSGASPSGTTISFNGISGAADGAMALLFGILLVLALGSRGVADSRTRVVQLLPAGLGLASVAYMAIGVRELPAMNAALQDLGVEASTGVGVWLEAAGALLAFVVGVVASLCIIRRNPVRREAAASASAVDRTFVQRALAWLIGGLAGLAVGVWLAVGQYGSTGSPFVPAYAVGGLILGFFLADTVFRLFEPDEPSRRG